MKQQAVRPYVLLLIINDNKVLLVNRTKIGTLKGNFYGLPGGKIDGCETPRRAAVREAFEELDIVVNPNDLQFVHVLHELVRVEHNGIEKVEPLIAFCFVVQQWQGTVHNKDTEAHESVDWFDLNKLPSSLLPVQKHIIEMMNKKIVYSEFTYSLKDVFLVC